MRKLVLVLALASVAAPAASRADYEQQTAIARAGKAAFGTAILDEDGDRSTDTEIKISLLAPPPHSTTGVVTGAGTYATAPIPGIVDVGKPWVSVEVAAEGAPDGETLCRAAYNPAATDWTYEDATYETTVTLRVRCGAGPDARVYTARWRRDGYEPGSSAGYGHWYQHGLLRDDRQGAEVALLSHGHFAYATLTLCRGTACAESLFQDVVRMFETTAVATVQR